MYCCCKFYAYECKNGCHPLWVVPLAVQTLTTTLASTAVTTAVTTAAPATTMQAAKVQIPLWEHLTHQGDDKIHYLLKFLEIQCDVWC